MNALRRMVAMIGGALIPAAIEEAQRKGVVIEMAPAREREPAPVLLMDKLKVKYKQTRKRITHFALKVGAWRVGQIMTLEVSRRQYQVFPDGSWRRLFNGVPRLAS